MALSITKTSPHGVETTYWKIYRLEMNLVEKKAECWLAGYANDIASLSCQPLMMEHFSWADGEFPFNNTQNNVDIAYSKITALLEWSTATSVSDEVIPPPENTDEIWQANKSPMLKTIENIYIDFLTNDWTPMLKKYGLIPPDHVITVDNTDSVQNITLLFTLRAYNKDDYYKMAGEFDRYKSAIESNGGIMAKVRHHDI